MRPLMQGKLFGPPEQRTAAAANTGIDKAGRFRRWLRKNRLPLTGTLTVALAFAGTFAVMETGPGVDSDRYALYAQGKINISQFSLDDRIKAWHFRLGFNKGCGAAAYLEVLAEVRKEIDRCMGSRDSGSLEKLFDVERAATELYRSEMKDPMCTRDAGR